MQNTNRFIICETQGKKILFFICQDHAQFAMFDWINWVLQNVNKILTQQFSGY